MENFEDLFSLEDDDVSQMFITQEGKEPISELLDKSNDDVDADKNIFLGSKVTNFQMPTMSFVQKRNLPEYSDISDDDFMPVASQKKKKNGVSMLIINLPSNAIAKFCSNRLISHTKTPKICNYQ